MTKTSNQNDFKHILPIDRKHRLTFKVKIAKTRKNNNFVSITGIRVQ